MASPLYGPGWQNRLMTEPVALSGDPAADALLTRNPLALLIGMVLDQQIPIERAFHAPLELEERMGRDLDAASISSMPPDELAGLFAERPALHRFPGSMAKRVQELCQQVVERYGGQPAAIWLSAETGDELLASVKQLPGFGDDKARKFVAFVGKRLKVTPKGWKEASSPFGEPGTFLSVADIDGPESLARVRSQKKAMKAAARASRRG